MDVLALSNFLHESNEAEEERQNQTNTAQFTPGDIGPSTLSTNPEIKTTEEKEKDPKAIWSEEEVPYEGAIEDPFDDRPPPKYDIAYKQMVGTQDVFGGFGDISPASQDCTHLVVKVHFPGCKLADLDVTVKKQHIRVESPTKKLSTYLPEPVDDKNGDAKWNSKKETLIITLPIDKTAGF
mmetsp:Transcript_12/g.15  ORF Transcript_12/g.15 Transcript_12/m.15 type:complete len:181 (+) Transcript_12:187-729(+)|eukprot:CAMPEP_0117744104 /NCGR_PEP_ID=MMETSP0947-20121206/6551_1 /TAXON_ID=44440 /ORGANISM="Chattonella subsalsa, Strain CCMP2191" /LENGTH=180 /DNA_ID=CAMNT_0005560971 /DNA_START=286 /DNA_END=828 /DNA_ORIENTATION=+